MARKPSLHYIRVGVSVGPTPTTLEDALREGLAHLAPALALVREQGGSVRSISAHHSIVGGEEFEIVAVVRTAP